MVLCRDGFRIETVAKQFTRHIMERNWGHIKKTAEGGSQKSERDFGKPKMDWQKTQQEWPAPSYRAKYPFLRNPDTARHTLRFHAIQVCE